MGIAFASIAFVPLGCGSSSGVSSTKIARLTERASKVEAENVTLRRKQAHLSETVASLTAAIGALRANDKALETGVAMAQLGVVCGPTPPQGCHVPLGTPGAIYEDETKPGRIFATPLP